METKNVLSHTVKAASRSFLIVFMLVLTFVLSEPVVTRSAPAEVSDDFIITQEILGELSLTLGNTTVVMSGAIGGVLGGNATGTNTAIVRSNSGYTMSIEFENDPAMLGDNTGSDGIQNYDPAGAEPDFDFVASSSALFAYTVASQPTADLDASFKDQGGVCGGAATVATANRCWAGPSTSPYQVISRSSDTGTGSATTTFTFVVNVPPNPVPSVPADFYTATATLTAIAIP